MAAIASGIKASRREWCGLPEAAFLLPSAAAPGEKINNYNSNQDDDQWVHAEILWLIRSSLYFNAFPRERKP
jgi:hypothetical protein